MYKQIHKYTKHGRHIRGGRAAWARLASAHPFAVPLAALGVMTFITLVGLLAFNIGRPAAAPSPNVVVISYDGQQQVVSSEQPTVEALLKKVEVKINEGDVVEPALSTRIQQDDFRINIYRAVPVEVIDGQRKTFSFSAAKTSRSVAKQAGIEVFPEDKIVTAPVTDFVRTGGIAQQVSVTRATPVNVNLYGTQIVMRTHATTVRELLKEKKVELREQDIVQPGIDQPLTANAQLAVIRNGLTTATVQEDIPMPVENIPDANLSYGVSVVRQQGSAGKRAVTYQINTQNGVEVSRTPIQTVVVQEPIAEIRATGSNISGIKGDMGRAGISPSDYQYVDYIVTKESGWNPSARNASSGAYGLCQALPATKMASAGADWETNPVTQLRWCNSYAVGRYGTWAAAYSFWQRNHWW